MDAINHEMRVEEVQLKVGAIKLSPGFEVFNAELRGEFGSGDYENVITRAKTLKNTTTWPKTTAASTITAA